MISEESPAVEKMEGKSSVEFQLTVPDLSTPDRIQDGRQKKYKTRFRFSKMSGKKSTGPQNGKRRFGACQKVQKAYSTWYSQAGAPFRPPRLSRLARGRRVAPPRGRLEVESEAPATPEGYYRTLTRYLPHPQQPPPLLVWVS